MQRGGLTHRDPLKQTNPGRVNELLAGLSVTQRRVKLLTFSQLAPTAAAVNFLHREGQRLNKCHVPLMGRSVVESLFGSFADILPPCGLRVGEFAKFLTKLAKFLTS